MLCKLLHTKVIDPSHKSRSPTVLCHWVRCWLFLLRLWKWLSSRVFLLKLLLVAGKSGSACSRQTRFPQHQGHRVLIHPPRILHSLFPAESHPEEMDPGGGREGERERERERWTDRNIELIGKESKKFWMQLHDLWPSYAKVVRAWTIFVIDRTITHNDDYERVLQMVLHL